MAPGYRGVNPWSRVWWSRAAHITAARKQRKGDRGRREDQEPIALKDIFLVTYLLHRTRHLLPPPNYAITLSISIRD